MTTIAYRDGYVAADTACWRDGTLMGHIDKLIMAEDGVLFTGAGVVSEIRSFAEAYDSREPFPTLGEETIVVQFNPKKRIMEHMKEGAQFLCNPKDYMSWGSGAQIAIGALAQGATAEEAVKAAIKHDAFTQGKVKVVKVW